MCVPCTFEAVLLFLFSAVYLSDLFPPEFGYVERVRQYRHCTTEGGVHRSTTLSDDESFSVPSRLS